MKRFGFYSDDAGKKFGYQIWSTPDGKEVRVTGTDYSPLGTTYLWPDKKYVGPVIELIRKVKNEE